MRKLRCLPSGRPQEGFTLIEFAITAALMAVLMLAFIQLTSNNMRAQKGVLDTSDLNSFGTMLQQLIGIPTVCSALLTANPGVYHAGAANPRAVRLNITGVATAPRTDLQETGFEIDYPKPAPFPTPGYVPNPANRLIKSGDTFKGWHVINEVNPATHISSNINQGMGLNVRAEAGSNTSYYVDVIVNFLKNTDSNGVPLSMGSTTGQRQASMVIVSTTLPSGGFVTVTGCRGPAANDSPLKPFKYGLYQNFPDYVQCNYAGSLAIFSLQAIDASAPPQAIYYHTGTTGGLPVNTNYFRSNGLSNGSTGGAVCPAALANDGRLLQQ